MSGPQGSVVLAPLPSVEEIAAQFSNPTPVDRSAGNEALQAALDSKDLRAPVDAQVAETVEEVVEEAAVEPIVEEVKEEKRDPLAGKFAAIARREREIRQREKEFEERSKADETRAAQLKEKEERLQRIKSSPIKNLKELGITWQDLIQDSVGQYEEKPVDPIDKRFSEVESKLSKIDEVEKELNKRFQVLADREQQAALQEVMDNIKSTAQGEKYELIQTLGDEAYGLVKDVMSEYFHEHKKFLDYSEACDIVEKWYEDTYVSKLTNTKKVQARFNTSSTQPAKTAPKPVPVKKEAKEPTSLTNSLNSATQATVDVDKMPRHEAIQYLASKLKFIND